MVFLIDNGHGCDTKGKCSPDLRLKEYAWARIIARKLEAELEKDGYVAFLVTPEDTDISLATRINRVNSYCSKFGTSNCVLVSIHNNAAGADGKWHDARGFSVFVSKNASGNSKRLANIFTDLAKNRNMLGNRSVPSVRYWTWSWTTADIAILKSTKCPAVLTENFFQDNKADVDYLLSEKGIDEVVKLHKDALVKYAKSLQ